MIPESIRNEFADHRSRAVAIASAMALVIVGCIGGIAESGSQNSRADQQSANKGGDTPKMDIGSLQANCGSLTLTGDVVAYQGGNFLPADGSVDNDDSAASYVQGLFGAQGPLAGKADRASLAAIDAAMAEQALDKTTDNDYDIKEQFDNDMNLLESNSGGSKEATELCDGVSQVMSATFAGYDSSAISDKESYLELKGIYGSVDGIADISELGLHQTTNTTGQAIGGIEFKVGAGNKLGGFGTVVIDAATGRIMIPGRLPTGGVTTGQNNEGKSGAKQHEQQQGNGQAVNGQAGGGTSGTSNGTSNNRAESPNKGIVPEHSKAGTSPGPNHRQGGEQGTKPGPLPSPNTGSPETIQTITSTVASTESSTPSTSVTYSQTVSSTETYTPPSTTTEVYKGTPTDGSPGA